MDSYFEQLEQEISGVIDVLSNKGINDEYLNFDKEIVQNKKISIPTNANSEFLANRAMGDWAEDLIINQINKDKNFFAIRYGSDDLIAAGEEGFKDFYTNLKKK